MSETLLKKDYVVKDVEADSFEELIRILAQPLIADDRVTPEFPDKVIERESIFPTGLPTEPYGVAIPHTDPQYVKENTISIAVLKNPLEMTVMGSDSDTVMVSIVFLLSLGESNKQMNILKKLMKGFQNAEALEAMMHGDTNAIFQIAKETMELE